MTEALINAGAEVNARERGGEEGDTPLHLAAWQNENPEVIQVLINAGADIEALSRNGNLPLVLAVQFNPAVVETLINAGADVTARTRSGHTALSVVKDPAVRALLRARLRELSSSLDGASRR